MTDVELPTYRDLMYPTLLAVDNLGGSAAISEIEELVPEIAKISETQLGVEFPEGSTQQGVSKVVHRLYWARTYLKKIGALNNSKQGVWSIIPKGQEFLSMDTATADEALRLADTQARADMRKAKVENAFGLF